MGDPTAVNNAAKNANAIIVAVVEVPFMLGKAAMIADFPFLATWPISFFFNKAADLVEGYIDRAAGEFATNTVIDVQTGIEARAVNEAKEELKAVLAVPPKQRNNDAVLAAKARFKEKLAALIHSDGSFTRIQ